MENQEGLTCCTLIITITTEDKKVEFNSMVFHIDKSAVSWNSAEICRWSSPSSLWTSLISMRKLSNLSNYSKKSHDGMKKTFVTGIKLEVGLIHQPKDQKYAIICIDATHSERYSHSQLKNVADTNGVKCINKHVWNIFLSIVNPPHLPSLLTPASVLW